VLEFFMGVKVIQPSVVSNFETTKKNLKQKSLRIADKIGLEGILLVV
jgi:hypothetical protein